MATENNTHINSFHKGMDTDTSYAALEEGKYSLAKNIRIVSTGYNNDAVTNVQFEVRPIKGVENAATWGEENGNPTIKLDRILATNSIRQYGLIVAAGNTTNDEGENPYTGDEWYVFSFDSNNPGNSLKLIFRSRKQTTKNKFSTVTKYEDTDIIKLYIATGDDPLIVLNILDENLYKMTLDQVRAYPAITFTPPVFKRLLSGGFLKPGLVQYSYRLYNKNGVSTDISPTTKLIPVVNYYGEGANKSGVQGYLEEDQPSIGAEITIDIDESYDEYLDRIQIFRIQYVRNGQLPTIECIQDTRIDALRTGENTLTITDTAQLVLSTLTLEEYNSMSGIHILPGIIESKYDYMFASKIKEETDWMSDQDFANIMVKAELVCDTQQDSPLKPLAGDYSPIKNSDGYIAHNTISYTADDYSDDATYSCDLHSYAEPEIFMNRKSLRRGETYRYGVVFYNKYGEASKVKRLNDDIVVPYNTSITEPSAQQEAVLEYNSSYYNEVQPVEYATEEISNPELRYYVCDRVDHVIAWIIDDDTIEEQYSRCYNADGYWRFKFNGDSYTYIIYADPATTLWNEIEFEGYCEDPNAIISITAINEEDLFSQFTFYGSTVKNYKLSNRIIVDQQLGNAIRITVKKQGWISGWTHTNSPSVLWLKIKLRLNTNSVAGYDAFSTGYDANKPEENIELRTHPIGVKFHIENIPSDAVAYEIVRCNRTESDVRCLTQGVLSRPIKRLALGDPIPDPSYPDDRKEDKYYIDQFKYPYTPSGYLTTADFYREDYTKYDWDKYKDPFAAINYSNGSVFQFVSPEASYNKESLTTLLKNKKLQLLPIVYLYPNTELKCRDLVLQTAEWPHLGNIPTYAFNVGPSGAGMFYVHGDWSDAGESWLMRYIKYLGDVCQYLNKNSFGVFHRSAQTVEHGATQTFEYGATQAHLYAQSNHNGYNTSSNVASRINPTHEAIGDTTIPTEITGDIDASKYAQIKPGQFGYIKLYNATQNLWEGYKYDTITSTAQEEVSINFPTNPIDIKACVTSNDLGWDDVFTVSGNTLKIKYQNFENAVGNATYNNVIMGGQYGTPSDNDDEVAFKDAEPFKSDVGYNFYALGGPCLLLQTNDLKSGLTRDLQSPLVKSIIGDLEHSYGSDEPIDPVVARNLTQKQFGTFLCNIIQNVDPYGGSSINAIQLSTYYSYGNYHVLDSSESSNKSSEIEVFDGDCMIQPFEYMSAHKYYTGFGKNTGLSFSMIYSIPVETNINLSYTLGQEFSKGQLDARKSNSQLQPGNVYGRYIQDKPLYSYNSAYSSNAYTRAFAAFIDAEDRNDLQDPDYRVYHSLLKSAKESIDNWTKFQPANFIDVDSKYGPITDLKSFNNQLIFWQTDAVGVLSVNERAVVSTDNNTPLILGTGGVLDRYDYIDKTSGMSEDQFVKANSDTTLYWWNDKMKQIFAYRSGQTVEELGKTKRVQNALYSKDSDITIPTMFFNHKYNEAITNALTDKNQIAYSELLQAFTSLYTFDYEDAVEFSDKDYLVSLHENGDVMKVSLYDASNKSTNTDGKIMSAYLQYVVNKNVLTTKTFDNQEIVTVNILGGSGIENAEDKPYKDDKSYFTANHNYTWKTELNESQSGELNMTLREGNYRYAIPRAGDASYGNRIRGKYMVCSIEDTKPNCDASISYIITKFRTSWS